jgi:hypothetical protein
MHTLGIRSTILTGTAGPIPGVGAAKGLFSESRQLQVRGKPDFTYAETGLQASRGIPNFSAPKG